MIFLGYGFAGGQHSLDTTPLLVETITSLTIFNGIYDEFMITRNVKQEYSTEIENIWDYDTILHAYFKDDLFAGNVNFKAENTDTIRIKRRKKNTFKWVFLFEIPISSVDDFSFELFDYTPRSNTTYEYSLIPVSGSIEGNLIVGDIKTDFPGLFITERDKYFKTISEIDINSQQQNRQISVVPTMGKKYPFVIRNGMNNYKSGTLSALFVLIDENACNYDFKNGWEYREQFNDFLFNNLPKLLKYEDGRMWLICISSDKISETEDGHELKIKTSFEWTEIDDCDSGVALYTNGFIDFSSEV